MATHEHSIDIRNLPEVERLAEAVRKTRTPFVLRRGNEVVATIVPEAAVRATLPARKRRARDIEADLAAIRASAGSWKGLVDAEQLKKDIKAARGSDRPDVEL